MRRDVTIVMNGWRLTLASVDMAREQRCQSERRTSLLAVLSLNTRPHIA